MTNNVVNNDPSDHDFSAHDALRPSPDAGDEERVVLRARVHLLAADGLLAETVRHPPREYFTLCAQVITDSDLPHAGCPDEECNCELRYCPACIQNAAGWNAEIEEEMQALGWTARVRFDGEIDAPAGVTVRRDASPTPGGTPGPRRP
ncbi:MAG: hypothetical protein JO115_01815 [Pseudonocardiales bacterium]|nr:hypothetical protein [Pseudonocardiales bacterium]